MKKIKSFSKNRFQKLILIMGMLCIILITIILCQITPKVSSKVEELVFKNWGDVSEIIIPVEIANSVTIYRGGETKDAAVINMPFEEETIIIPENIDISENDYINCKLTTYGIGSSFIYEVEYAETQHYYLMKNGKYYAGMNKGVALFTDNVDGAVKFTQLHVNGEYGLLTWINISYITEQIGEYEFVLCDK